MAESDKIKGSDLVVPGYLKDAIEEAQNFLDTIKGIKGELKAVNKATAEKLKKSKSNSSKEIKEQNALLKESEKQRVAMIAVEAQELNAINKLNKAKQDAIAIEKKSVDQAEKNKKAVEAQNSAYAQASKRLNELRKQYKDLAVAGKGADKATEELVKEITRLDKQLKKVDADVGQFNREVGNYKAQMKGAITETAVFSAGMGKLDEQTLAAVAGFGAMIKQLKELQKAQKTATTLSGKLSNSLKIGGIGILLAAVASLASFFESSREGALEFDLIMARLKGTLDVVVGSLAQVGKGIVLFGSAMKDILSGDFDKAAKKIDEGMTVISHSFDGTTQDIETQTAAYVALTLAIFKFEDQLRGLQIELAKVRMDEEDFNEIMADQTIALKYQKAALESGIKARLRGAEIEEEIAKKELDIAWARIELDLRKNKVSEDTIAQLKKEGVERFLQSQFTTKVTESSLHALQEKYLAELHAADQLDDLDRQEAQRRRQMHQEEIINQIELIRSKKLGADAEVKILQEQVNDEKIQLELREKYFQELTNARQAALNEEIKLMTEFGLTEAEILDLINEKDAVRLEQKLTELRLNKLSQAQADEVAKVVLEAQTNQLEYEKQIKKFEEERIAREQKILQLQQETLIINQQTVLQEIQNMEQQRQKIIQDSNNTILQNNNVFNKDLMAQREQAFNEYSALLNQEYLAQLDISAKQYQLDRQNIENSITDEQVRNAEIAKLDAKYRQDQINLQKDYLAKRDDLTAQEVIQLQQIENRKTQIIVENLEKTTQALVAELDKKNQIQNDNTQRELDATERRIEKQQDLAARGLQNQLAFEEAQRDKRLLAQQDAERKQAKQKENIALAQALLNAYNSELQQPNANPQTAAFKALADVLVFKGIAAGLVQFAAEGNNDVQGPGTTKSDSIPFMLSKHEGVVKAEANMGNPGVVAALNAGIFDKLYMPRFDHAESAPNRHINAEALALNFAGSYNEQMLDKLDQIANKETQSIDVDKLGNLIDIRTKANMKKITKYKRGRI